MLCRLCLKDNIKDAVTGEDFPEIAEIVRNTLDINIDEKNEYPRTICVNCYETTLEYYSFRARCIENQKTLKIRQMKEKVAEKKRKTDSQDSQEIDNEVIFVCEIKPDEKTESESQGVSDTFAKAPLQDKKPPKTYKDVSRKRQLPQVSKNQKVRRTPLKSQMEMHGISPCRVVLERLTADAIARIIRMYQRPSTHNPYPKNNQVFPGDHNYYIPKKPPNPDPSKTKSVIQVVRTYCNTANKWILSCQNTPPALRNDPGESSKRPPDTAAPPTSAQPRLKVLSSAEINSRAAMQRQMISCTLINNRGRLDFNFTDEKANEIDFWSMTERQKKDILSTFQPESVLRKLTKYFKTVPITRAMEAKLLSLYEGTIPFTVIVED